ncbi:DNA methyltransferase [Methanospirillum stamsii]|uniref:DNA modification methylase n=1 Tax=Methanospirillum stamsii TaxID=1277351 RepID=A0A2V2N8I1_9EURY|nr:DNA methyltransferase [Methanospirillum stamsii]PWR76149.1 DNA modification methylase [Methanospirillum stamsii]
MNRSTSYVHDYLQNFRLPSQDGQTTLTAAKETQCDLLHIQDVECCRYIGEFWTARQRQASKLQEISYRACFKPQLPRFFITLLTEPDDIIYDPFAGRGTTPLEAALLGRLVISNDINPLSRILTEARLSPPAYEDIRARLYAIPDLNSVSSEMDLSMFYHPDTLRTLCSLRAYILEQEEKEKCDMTDRWIRMVATNRLSGHSPGFFSVYTLPPNQAVSPERQITINRDRSQTPPYRDVREIILKKTRSLLQGISERQKENLSKVAPSSLFLTKDARNTPEILDNTVSLTVTSPPFLDIVQYAADNWLRCWFNGLDAELVGKKISTTRKLTDWEGIMRDVFRELFRITRPGGYVAFEVGEVRNGSVRLDEHVIPLGISAGFSCTAVIINQQDFTKTANIWGVNNMSTGTNTNRIVLFYKDF